MSAQVSLERLRRLIAVHFPSPNDRKVCLHILAAGIERAAKHGDNRWVTKLHQAKIPRLRLHVGPVIVQSLIPNGAWLSLDKLSLDGVSPSAAFLDHLTWHSGDVLEEYPEYPSIGSKNRYFYPGGVRKDDFISHLWPNLQAVHFAAIDRAALRNKNGVGARVGRGHDPAILQFLEAELKRELPRPRLWAHEA